MADATQLADLHEFTKEERYDWLKAHPSGAAHLFRLLDQGKGDADAFDTMVCRIMRSERNAQSTAANPRPVFRASTYRAESPGPVKAPAMESGK